MVHSVRDTNILRALGGITNGIDPDKYVKVRVSGDKIHYKNAYSTVAGKVRYWFLSDRPALGGMSDRAKENFDTKLALRELMIGAAAEVAKSKNLTPEQEEQLKKEVGGEASRMLPGLTQNANIKRVKVDHIDRLMTNIDVIINKFEPPANAALDQPVPAQRAPKAQPTVTTQPTRAALAEQQRLRDALTSPQMDEFFELWGTISEESASDDASMRANAGGNAEAERMTIQALNKTVGENLMRNLDVLIGGA